jgi:hypothetical protein
MSVVCPIYIQHRTFQGGRQFSFGPRADYAAQQTARAIRAARRRATNNPAQLGGRGRLERMPQPRLATAVAGSDLVLVGSKGRQDFGLHLTH